MKNKCARCNIDSTLPLALDLPARGHAMPDGVPSCNELRLLPTFGRCSASAVAFVDDLRACMRTPHARPPEGDRPPALHRQVAVYIVKIGASACSVAPSMVLNPAHLRRTILDAELQLPYKAYNVDAR